MIKRIFDIIISLIALIILSPLFLIFAFLIKWDSEGPVFVKLKRVSRGKEFYLFKFRSMIKNAHELKPLLLQFNERKNSPFFKIRNDPRVTRFGRFLRKHHLDELPELINVLKGEISLVGPRPHEPEEIEIYKNTDYYKRISKIKAGVTGLSQISGDWKLSFDEEKKLDLYYLENQSLWLDLKIILITITKIFKE